jgi:hypothetical protein
LDVNGRWEGEREKEGERGSERRREKERVRVKGRTASCVDAVSYKAVIRKAKIRVPVQAEEPFLGCRSVTVVSITFRLEYPSCDTVVVVV